MPAGGSSRGQFFAAEWADTIVTDAGSVEAMRTCQENVHKSAITAGRYPDGVKVLLFAYPPVDIKLDAARERRDGFREAAGIVLVEF